MTFKKEYAILSVIIVALGLYLFFRNADRTTYTLPVLPAVDAQDLTKIEIGKGSRTVVLTRSGDGWTVSPGDYPADAGLVRPMLDALADLTATTLISETKNYARYELDEKHQVRVTAYAGDRAVRTFAIGKAADTWRHTHITLADDPNVYHARGNFRMDFDQTVEDLRDKTVLKFDTAKVTALSIASGDRQVDVTRHADAEDPKETDAAPEEETADKPAARWETADGQTVDSATVDGLLSALSGLKCRAYLTETAQTDLADPAHTVRIVADGEVVLEIFSPADEDATEMPARSSLRSDPFTLADFDLDPINDFLASLEGTEATASP
jgi:hypothetical protein